MSTSYLITGVSRGLGFAFLSNLSANPDNIVIGLVRDKAATETKITSELGNRSNVHIFQADLVSREDVNNTVEGVSSVTGGRLDYIIANAALISHNSANLPIGVAAANPDKLEEEFLDTFRINVLGQVNLFTAYLPLILKGREKKVAAITSAMGDLLMIRSVGLKLAAPYSVSKAALNALIAKYHVQYADQGVLFLAVCPGLVNTGHQLNATPEEQTYMEEMMGQIMKYASTARLREPDEAATDVLAVIHKSSLGNGDGGQFLSHLGSTTQWL